MYMWKVYHNAFEFSTERFPFPAVENQQRGYKQFVRFAKSVGILFSYQKLLKYDHLSMMDRLVLFLAEYLGTAILVFLGCAGCVKYREGSGPGSLEVAFAFGFAIIIAVQTVGHISGAHINPVITLAALIMGVTPLIQVPLYLGGQFLGSLTGYGLLKTLVPQEYIKRSQDNVSLCSPEPNPKLQDAQIVFMEFLLTFFLVLIVCSAWDNRNSTKLDSLAIKLGLAVAGLALVGVSICHHICCNLKIV
ncbi:unnamed protein product [Acanthoscelides obtectus]|uniref:Uncharacterized protein n=1 Tax=Acanthoscelides obtectus TaxID=200917 RepID=A0A9P0NTL8_ACAOB|nr:unnamed protein product [Acanthoscelides obtectus]CAK1661388.1 Aquaporin-5 [Acanthoscelides obtectus]